MSSKGQTPLISGAPVKGTRKSNEETVNTQDGETVFHEAGPKSSSPRIDSLTDLVTPSNISTGLSTIQDLAAAPPLTMVREVVKHDPVPPDSDGDTNSSKSYDSETKREISAKEEALLIQQLKILKSRKKMVSS